MKTSYFAKYRGKKGIAICLFVPFWFKGPHYRDLAPTKACLNEYKRNKLRNPEEAETIFTKRYHLEILDKLSPDDVYSDLGEDAVMECYENVNAGSFCHRRIVAEWLEKHLGINVPELQFDKTC